MGGYYLWDGLQRFMRSGGLGVSESTELAQVEAATAAQQVQRQQVTRTLIPSSTPMPECQDFRVDIVDAPNAIVRAAPSASSEIVTAFPNGTIVCVLWRDAGSAYYTIDGNPTTRRYELAYMHESVLVPLDPTPTPTASATPPPTVTPMPTGSATPTPLESAVPTATRDSAQPTMPASTDTAG
jgi:hypothetical protein